MMNDPSIVSITGRKKHSSATTDSLPSVLASVRDKAIDLLRIHIKELFSNADDALFEMAERATSNSEQSDLFETMRDLRLKSAVIKRHFLQHISANFAQLNQPPVEAPASAKKKPLEALSLVKDEALEESVAIDNMVAKVNRRDEQALHLLTTRCNHLLTLKITAKDHPLSARALSESFIKSCDSIEFSINVKLIVLKLFEKHVLSELKTLYQTTNQLLIAAGVLPDLKSAAPVTQKTRPATYNTAKPSLAQPSKDLDFTLNELRAMLANFHGPAVARQDTPADAVPLSSTDLMRLLSHLQQQTSRPTEQPADLRNQLDQLLIRLSQHSQSTRVVNQVDDDVINLVAMLFEFILDDHNLPDALKALIARLQIPLIKVAIQDKAFFNRPDHPARLLLNKIATAALGLDNQAQEQQDSLYQCIESTIQRALTEFTDDPHIFAELLADFVAFTNREQRRSALLEQRIRDAEQGRARTEQARLRVAQELNARLLGQTLPDIIVHLLQEAWSTVMLLNYLKYGDDAKQWHNCLATMDDLIWSAQTHSEPQAQLTQNQLVPSLLQQLHEGFSNAALDPFVTSALLERLKVLHAEINRQYEQHNANNAKPASLVKATSAATIEPATTTAGACSAIQQPSSAQISMLQVNASMLMPESSDAPTASDTELADHEPALATVDSLHTGHWIEFIQDDEHKLRCKLAAISKTTGRYIFVNRSGMKVLEKTRLELAARFKDKTAILLDDALLFDRALESVIGNLRRIKNN